jgi:hypothetical protein
LLLLLLLLLATIISRAFLLVRRDAGEFILERKCFVPGE